MVCNVIKVLSIDYNFTFGKHMIEFFRKGKLEQHALLSCLWDVQISYLQN